VRPEIVPAKTAHASYLAARLRAEDVAEVAAFGFTAEGALLDSLEHSSSAWTVLLDDRPAAMLGLIPASALLGRAHPWMLGSDALRGVPLAMVRSGRAIVRLMLRTYPELRTAVDLRYTAALRWALMLGFQLGAPIPIGVNGEMFVPIEARASWA
jgi:hypothetical protein